MRAVRLVAFALATLFSAACGAGGGGAGGGSVSVVPTVPAGGASAAPAPPKTSAAPAPSPSTHASPTPIPTPTPMPSYYPPDAPSKVSSSYGRIGLAQVFDDYPSDGTQMSASQIAADANRYNFVWGSFYPQLWRTANPQALVSRYYIMEEDNVLISGNSLQWWQQNHPDWILYACTSSGAPTHDYAYSPGDGFADVPLNIHNPSVVQYQVNSLLGFVGANGYNAVAIDQVLFSDFMVGGSPELGQTENTSEYACGTWNMNGTFNMIYTGRNDPTWIQDTLNWVSAAKTAASAAGVGVFVNHGLGNPSSSNEQALLKMVDGTLDEPGFSDYGDYQSSSLSTYFLTTFDYMEWVEHQGVAFIDIDRFTLGGQTTVTSDQLEYAIGTYMMGNEGNAYLYVNANNGSGYGYGAEQYHQEYATALGPPCDAMYEDAHNLQIYYRRFENGMVVVNSGGSGTENATLPANHTYTDLEQRPVSNPLAVSAFDAYVLVLNQGSGNGCT